MSSKELETMKAQRELLRERIYQLEKQIAPLEQELELSKVELNKLAQEIQQFRITEYVRKRGK